MNSETAQYYGYGKSTATGGAPTGSDAGPVAAPTGTNGHGFPNRATNGFGPPPGGDVPGSGEHATGGSGSWAARAINPAIYGQGIGSPGQRPDLSPQYFPGQTIAGVSPFTSQAQQMAVGAATGASQNIANDSAFASNYALIMPCC